MNEKLPPLNEKSSVTVETLCSLFFEELMTFAKFMNDTNGKVEDWKFADFIVYAMQQEINGKFKGMKREFEKG